MGDGRTDVIGLAQLVAVHPECVREKRGIAQSFGDHQRLAGPARRCGQALFGQNRAQRDAQCRSALPEHSGDVTSRRHIADCSPTGLDH
ncbi:hypothetical protein [Saccharothrix sp. ALI-22-I]|uniref:hypothetical protein n=1 Tax=Saccharothrix sp. ALI-22-I TaxID=1933778 RepID=UPI003FD5BA3A